MMWSSGLEKRSYTAEAKRIKELKEEVERLRKRVCAHHLRDDSTFDIDGCSVCREALQEEKPQVSPYSPPNPGRGTPD